MRVHGDPADLLAFHLEEVEKRKFKRDIFFRTCKALHSSKTYGDFLKERCDLITVVGGEVNVPVSLDRARLEIEEVNKELARKGYEIPDWGLQEIDRSEEGTLLERLDTLPFLKKIKETQ